jgi:hypothetical protein
MQNGPCNRQKVRVSAGSLSRQDDSVTVGPSGPDRVRSHSMTSRTLVTSSASTATGLPRSFDILPAADVQGDAEEAAVGDFADVIGAAASPQAAIIGTDKMRASRALSRNLNISLRC